MENEKGCPAFSVEKSGKKHPGGLYYKKTGVYLQPIGIAKLCQPCKFRDSSTVEHAAVIPTSRDVGSKTACHAGKRQEKRNVNSAIAQR
jgi:hypothetical protein